MVTLFPNLILLFKVSDTMTDEANLWEENQIEEVNKCADLGSFKFNSQLMKYWVEIIHTSINTNISYGRLKKGSECL